MTRFSLLTIHREGRNYIYISFYFLVHFLIEACFRYGNEELHNEKIKLLLEILAIYRRNRIKSNEATLRLNKVALDSSASSNNNEWSMGTNIFIQFKMDNTQFCILEHADICRDHEYSINPKIEHIQIDNHDMFIKYETVQEENLNQETTGKFIKRYNRFH